MKAGHAFGPLVLYHGWGRGRRFTSREWFDLHRTRRHPLDDAGWMSPDRAVQNDLAAGETRLDQPLGVVARKDHRAFLGDHFLEYGLGFVPGRILRQNADHDNIVHHRLCWRLDDILDGQGGPRPEAVAV